MISKTLDQNIKLYAKTYNVKIGETVKVDLKLLGENKKDILASKSYEEVVKKDSGTAGKIDCKLTIRDLANELSIKPEDVKYLSGWIDTNNDNKITRGYDKEVFLKVVKEKKKIHFVFYTLTGSKNDNIFVTNAQERVKSIKKHKDYDENIDIIYIQEVKKSSEILSFAKNKIKENGGKEETEVKTVELFAELFKEEKKEVNDSSSSIDTSNHWINNLAQPYISKDTNINEARTSIASNVKRKEYLNKIYEDNQEQFLKDLKSGTIQGLKYVETYSAIASLTTLGKTPPQIPIFFAIVGGLSSFAISRMEKESATMYITKLGINTTFDIISEADKRLTIANELIIKPYFTYIIDNISKDKN